MEWSEDPAFQVLIDKAWDATGFHKLSPEAGSYLDRISGLKSAFACVTTVAIFFSCVCVHFMMVKG